MSNYLNPNDADDLGTNIKNKFTSVSQVNRYHRLTAEEQSLVNKWVKTGKCTLSEALRIIKESDPPTERAGKIKRTIKKTTKKTTKKIIKNIPKKNKINIIHELEKKISEDYHEVQKINMIISELIKRRENENDYLKREGYDEEIYIQEKKKYLYNNKIHDNLNKMETLKKAGFVGGFSLEDIKTHTKKSFEWAKNNPMLASTIGMASLMALNILTNPSHI